MAERRKNLTLRPAHDFRGARTVLSTATALLLVGWAFAQGTGDEPGSCLSGADATTLAVASDWRVVVDASTGLALKLPPGHELAPNGESWYVHGSLDGTPLVPDMVIRRHPSVGVELLATELFGAGAVLEAVRLGPATAGFRVRLGRGTVDAATEVLGYFAVAGASVYSLQRYEAFQWDGFGAVACSMHLVELVRPQ